MAITGSIENLSVHYCIIARKTCPLCTFTGQCLRTSPCEFMPQTIAPNHTGVRETIAKIDTEGVK